MDSAKEGIHHQQQHQKFLLHVLCAIIMGADIILDIMQAYHYGKLDHKTRDLFIASLTLMSIVPVGFALAISFLLTTRLLCLSLDLFKGKDNFQWGFMFGMCVWCVVGLFIPLVITTFLITFVLSVPVMVLVVLLAPAYGLHVVWRYADANQRLRVFYFVRYIEGLVCAFPHFVINIIFMQRMGECSTQAVAAAIFSLISVCQVCYQAFGLKRLVCRCRDDCCVSFDGLGTLKEVVQWNTGKHLNIEVKVATKP